MRLHCPKCSTAYRVDDKLVTGKKPTFRCSRCGHVFVVEVRSATSEEQKDEAVMDTGSAQALDKFEDELRDSHPTAVDSANQQAAPSAESLTSPKTVGPDDVSDARAKRRGVTDASRTEELRFDVDEDFFIFPKEDSENDSKKIRAGGQLSVLPFISLFAILLFVFSLVTMTYQIDPAPLESVIRSIPWFGPAVFESKHFKSRLELAALASGFQPILGDQEVVIISGKLFNRNPESVENVRIEAQIYDAEGKPVGKEIVYLGNALSSKNIQDMTTREIELLQSLKPQNVYRIEPNQAVNFTIVLPKPKTTVTAFSCKVLSAESTA